MEKKKYGLGIASFIIGIISLLMMCLPIGFFVGIISLILGIVGCSRRNQSNGLCVTGIVLSIISIVFSTIVFLSQLEESNPKSDNSIEQEKITKGSSFNVDGLNIHIDDVIVGYTDYEDEYGFHELKEGKQYAYVTFTCKNNGDSDKYVSIYDYDCYADGSLCDEYYGFNEDFINVNLSSGRNVTFSTCYIVPSDAKEIELEYTENIWTDDKIIIKIK